MNDELTKITLTFPMRYGTPNRNGTIYTKEAIEHAFGSSNPNMPIIMHGNEEFNKYIIGFTEPTYYFDWDDKSKVCNVTLTGRVFNVGVDGVINKMDDGKITDFDIRSINISK